MSSKFKRSTNNSKSCDLFDDRQDSWLFAESKKCAGASACKKLKSQKNTEPKKCEKKENRVKESPQYTPECITDLLNFTESSNSAEIFNDLNEQLDLFEMSNNSIDQDEAETVDLSPAKSYSHSPFLAENFLINKNLDYSVNDCLSKINNSKNILLASPKLEPDTLLSSSKLSPSEKRAKLEEMRFNKKKQAIEKRLAKQSEREAKRLQKELLRTSRKTSDELANSKRGRKPKAVLSCLSYQNSQHLFAESNEMLSRPTTQTNYNQNRMNYYSAYNSNNVNQSSSNCSLTNGLEMFATNNHFNNKCTQFYSSNHLKYKQNYATFNTGAQLNYNNSYSTNKLLPILVDQPGTSLSYIPNTNMTYDQFDLRLNSVPEANNVYYQVK